MADDVLRPFRLDGRTALITGIGPGIGEHVALAYAAAGARIVACSRTAAKVEDLAARIEAAGGTAIGVAADVSRADDVERLLDEATARFGPVHVLFHNATGGGVGRRQDSLDLSTEDWSEGVAIHLTTPFRMAQALIPGMREAGGGSIINVLSTAGFTPVPGIGAMAYGATKAGLEMLTRYLALECGPEVRANCLCPGTIDPHGETRPVWEPILGKIPMKRVGFAQEVAGAALFLASDASSYITGQTIFVDGGRVNAGSGM
ncbi:MAG: SDR family oxidoreductase [Acidobacteria bacterium]|nr:SDR family oxidoreductase [Acidobacteriota bacterium]